MNWKRILPTLISLLLVVLAVAHVAYYYPHLPETVATHFDGAGKENGFSSKLTHSIVTVVLQVGTAGLFLGLGWILNILPPSMINMPNKDYWLAPERKAESVRRMRDYMAWLGIATQGFLLTLSHLTVLHNLGVPAMKWFWPVFAGYMLFVMGYTIRLMLIFRIPDDPNQSFGQSVR